MFIKKKEDFYCEHCREAVTGDGYTNHCPSCLWSRHVDIDPGDRAAICKGMMEPVGINKKNGEVRILHRCLECKFERMNRVENNDNEELLVPLSL